MFRVLACPELYEGGLFNMPRIKKTTLTDNVEIKANAVPEEQLSIVSPVSTADHKDLLKNDKSKKKSTKNITPAIQQPVVENSKKEFKQLHIKDVCWLENDIFQTIADLTEGKKIAKAIIINQALKDYLQKNKLEIKPLRPKAKK